jgi:hypothetical protein
MENQKVLLERHRKRDYTVRFENKRYFWAGAKGNIISKVLVPREVYDYLAMSSNCLKNGELIVSANTPKELKEDLDSEIYEKEEQEANALTRDDVEKILKGNMAYMKSALEKITSFSTKQFVLDVAKDMKLSNVNKQKFIKDWYGTELSLEDLFELDEE